MGWLCHLSSSLLNFFPYRSHKVKWPSDAVKRYVIQEAWRSSVLTLLQALAVGSDRVAPVHTVAGAA